VSVSLDFDTAQARRFTSLLGEPLTFQTFSDRRDINQALPNGKLRDPYAAWKHDSFDALELHLTRVNSEGAGVFVMINESDGRGRSNKHVVHIKAVFIDTDGAPLPTNLPLDPHIVVQSSPGRWHIYWLVNGVLLEDFGNIQAALAEKYGTDPTITDRCRVMRLPGLFHNKREPYRVELLHAQDAPAYTAAQIFGAWPEIAERIERERVEVEKRRQEAAQRRLEAEQRRKDDDTRTLDQKRAHGILRSICSRIAGTKVERNNALLRAARTIGGFVASGYLAEDEGREALALAAGECGLDDGEITGCISRGLCYGLTSPLYLTEDDTRVYGTGSERVTISPAGQKPRSYRSRVCARMGGWGHGRA
jgi:hypothetical protein